MTDAHQPPLTPITFIDSSLELAEKELAKAQKEATGWQTIVDSLRRARSEVQNTSSYAKPQKNIDKVIAYYREKGQEAHIGDVKQALNLTEKEMRSLSTQLGTKARNKTMFYRVKGKKATFGLLELQK